MLFPLLGAKYVILKINVFVVFQRCLVMKARLNVVEVSSIVIKNEDRSRL